MVGRVGRSFRRVFREVVDVVGAVRYRLSLGVSILG